MKFSTALTDFAKVLNYVLPAVPKKTTSPALEHFFFSLDGNSLNITATDQEIIFKTSLEVQGEESGSILVPAQLISGFLNALNGAGNISFIADEETNKITLRTENGNYSMKGIGAEEYVTLPVLSDSPANEVPPTLIKRADIQRLINLTSFAVSTDEFRPAMSGIFLQFRGNYIYSVATDSYRLVRATVMADSKIYPEDFDVILPIRAAEILKKIDSDIEMTPINNQDDRATHLCFKFGNTTFITKVIIERFPPYETVIPQNNEFTMGTDRKSFLAAIKHIQFFTSALSPQFRMTVYPDHLILGAENDEIGSNAIEKLPCDFNCEKMTIGFNIRYLEDILTHLEPSANTKEDNIYFFMSQPTRPVLINTEIGSQTSLMLIMPVRISVDDVEEV